MPELMNNTAYWEVLLSFSLGLALSASCGFRVFVPPLVLSVAALFLGVQVPEQIAWIGTYPAFMIFLSAALLEIGAYYVPWLDNMLDSVATPAAVIAGTLLTSSFITADMDPILQWTIALVAGGGAAGAIQATTTSGRLTSLAATGGFTNPVVASIENVMAFAVPVVTILFPAVAVIVCFVVLAVLVMMAIYSFRFLQSRFNKEPSS